MKESSARIKARSVTKGFFPKKLPTSVMLPINLSGPNTAAILLKAGLLL